MAAMREILYLACGRLYKLGDLGVRCASKIGIDGERMLESKCRWASISNRYVVLSHRLGGLEDILVRITAGEKNKRLLLVVAG